MNNRVTIKDIAEKLGLATSTVSLALKDHPGISQKTREKVKKMAKKMGYVPDPMAKALATGKSMMVGVLAPHLLSFVPELLKGIEKALEKSNMGLLLRTYEDNEAKLTEVVEFLIEKGVEGIIAVVGVPHHIKIVTATTDLPVIFVSGAVQKAPGILITVDGFSGTFEATCHLIKQGRKKIVHLAGPPTYSYRGRNYPYPATVERKKGYEAAMGMAGMEPIVYHTGFSVEEGYKITQLIWKEEKPDAIVAAADYIAIGAMKFLLSNNIKIPDDVAITGFDDLPVCEMLYPSLSSVRIPAKNMGEIAVTMLGKDIKESIILKPQFIRRQTA